MGFYSTAVTDTVFRRGEIPDWFRDKYRDRLNFPDLPVFCLSSKADTKDYGTFADLHLDIQRILPEKATCTLLYLHECKGVTRFRISKDEIVSDTPNKFVATDGVEHGYGCIGEHD